MSDSVREHGLRINLIEVEIHMEYPVQYCTSLLAEDRADILVKHDHSL